MAANLALDAALALAHTPTLAEAMRRRPLPTGVEPLLQILAGDGASVAAAAGLAWDKDGHLLGAVELYVEQVMLYPGAPPRRVLGVDDGAGRPEMRRHMGLLMTWLHPDKNAAAEWRSAYAGRVLAAWRELSAEAASPPGRRSVSTREAKAPQPPPPPTTGMRDAQGRPAARRTRVPWVAQPLPARAKRRGFGWHLRWLLPAAVLLCAGLATRTELAGEFFDQWLQDDPLSAESAAPAPARAGLR